MATAVEVKLEDCMTSDQLAAHFGVHVDLIRREARNGKIPGCHQVLGNKYLFEREAVLNGYTPVRLQASTKEREPDGHYAKGHQLTVGNKGGRPTRVKEEKYLKSMVAIVTIEEWKAVVAKALKDAKAGKHAARVWLANYLIGKPIQRVIAVDLSATSVLSRDEMTDIVYALFARADERATREDEVVVDGEFRETSRQAESI